MQQTKNTSNDCSWNVYYPFMNHHRHHQIFNMIITITVGLLLFLADGITTINKFIYKKKKTLTVKSPSKQIKIYLNFKSNQSNNKKQQSDDNLKWTRKKIYYYSWIGFFIPLLTIYWVISKRNRKKTEKTDKLHAHDCTIEYNPTQCVLHFDAIAFCLLMFNHVYNLLPESFSPHKKRLNDKREILTTTKHNWTNTKSLTIYILPTFGFLVCTKENNNNNNNNIIWISFIYGSNRF